MNKNESKIWNLILTGQIENIELGLSLANSQHINLDFTNYYDTWRWLKIWMTDPKEPSILPVKYSERHIALWESKNISNVLHTLLNWTELNLSYHDIYEIPKCLTVMRNLKTLDFTSTKIGVIPLNIIKMESLELIRIEFCNNMSWDWVRQMRKDVHERCNITFMKFRDMEYEGGFSDGII